MRRQTMRTPERGFTLMEVMVALAIMSIFVIGS